MSNAYSATDRTRATTCVATQISRDLYQRLDARVEQLATTKGAYVRQLIEAALNDSQSQQHGVNA